MGYLFKGSLRLFFVYYQNFKGERAMRKKHILTIITMAAFMVFFVNLSHALVGIEVNPPSQAVDTPFDITIVVAVGEDAPSANRCNVMVDFGDGGTVINAGKCEVTSNACLIRTKHTYRAAGTYTIRAFSERNCSYNIGRPVSATVSILPKGDKRLQLPQPRKRPGY
jgi:hypothetical protein